MSLGSELGRLADPATGDPYDAIRLTLVSDLITTPPGSLTQQRWEECWQTAAASLATTLMDEATAELCQAQLQSRYPQRKLRPLLPDQVARDGLREKLASAGIALENCADDSEAVIAAERARAIALGSAWDEAMKIMTDEQRQWRLEVARVEQWRRPTAALWVITAVVLLLTLVVALWLGGLLTAPQWFAPVTEWYWE